MRLAGSRVEGLKLGQLAHPVRLALTGKTATPGLFQTIELVGKENSLARLQKAIEYIEQYLSTDSAD